MEKFIRNDFFFERGKIKMNPKLEDHLKNIDKQLSPLPASERVDIVQEIKSTIIEMEQEQISTQQIMDRLGEPKDLSKSYLGDLSVKSKGIHRHRLLIILTFYISRGLESMVIIPFLSVLSIGFMICGIIGPVLGAIKAIDYLFNLEIPNVSDIGIVLNGIVVLNPLVELLCSCIIGGLLYLAGKKSWQVMLNYCHKIRETKEQLISK